jgi:hypothetical protein
VLEGDEQCDDATALCCDATTCKFRDAGTECRPADGPCDAPDTCSGADGGCRNALAPVGQACQPSTSASTGSTHVADEQCVPKTQCDGKSPACVPSARDANAGATCNDQNQCSVDDKCNLYGECVGNLGACTCTEENKATACDDKEPCTQDEVNRFCRCVAFCDIFFSTFLIDD